jgi:hypothetical protein
MIAFIVPGLVTRSFGRAEVSTVPGRARHDLPLDARARHARAQHLGDAQILIADRAADVLPLGMLGIVRRAQRIEGDVAAAARHADPVRRLDRAVEQAVVAGIRVSGVVAIGEAGAIAVPGSQRAAVQLTPGGLVEARIGELAEAERAGRGAERQAAGALALVDIAVRAARRPGRILEVAGRIAVAGPADMRQQVLVARAPVEAVGLLEAGRGTVRAARHAAVGIVDQAPGAKPPGAVLGIEDPVPVDRSAQALRKDVGVKAVVAGGREEPDLAAGPLGRGQPLIARGIPRAELALRLGRRGHQQRAQRQQPGGDASHGALQRSIHGANTHISIIRLGYHSVNCNRWLQHRRQHPPAGRQRGRGATR